MNEKVIIQFTSSIFETDCEDCINAENSDDCTDFISVMRKIGLPDCCEFGMIYKAVEVKE